MLKTYFVGLTFLLIVADNVRCQPDYMFNFHEHKMPETWKEAFVRCYNEDDGQCEPDYKFNFDAGGWLKLHTTPETWEEAFVRCHNEGAVLASPLNKRLANALQSQMILFGVNGPIFLGIHDLFFKGRFTSVEGVSLSDMEIRWGSRGDGADTGDCLTMTVDGRAYYSSCKDPLPFICYRKLDNQTMNECGTFDDEYQLNQQTGSCYKVHREKLSWTVAYGICASEGGHLIILNDEEEARFVKGLFPTAYSNFFDPIHIGLRAWGKNRIWTTIQGERFSDVYNSWHPGQPDNYEGRQYRGALLRDGNVDDIAEEREGMFVCEKSPVSKRIETVSPPPPPPSTETLTTITIKTIEVQMNNNNK